MILGVIPARLNSKRLPNKPLQLIDGMPILTHVIKRALMSKRLDKLIVCTDDIKIAKLVKKNNLDVFLTSKNINSGTDRISIFLKKNKQKFRNLKLIVDIQCDEVFLNPKYLDRAINFHLKNIKKFDVVVPHTLTREENNKNYVKIISNQKNEILYLTRADAPLPFRSKKQPFKRHQDFITFEPNFIAKFKNLKNRNLENYEGIELLRVLENGYKMGTFKLETDSFSINTKKDLLKSLLLIQKDKFRNFYK
jgi:3-deoxy-manno-octulosonate cytidylyltransferase (CMP-KDO synthetase)